jgi:2-keto-4-pentenoate hydratase/2-oxohepta-3-ene-1,7-dioic acid hydratase in catechol pathway
MRYATFSVGSDPTPRLGIVAADRLIDASSLPGDGGRTVPSTLAALVQAGPDTWRLVSELAARAGDGAASHAFSEVRWHAPIPRPSRNVFCIGRNYAEHVLEGARARGEAPKIPQYPVFFTKATTTVTGPFDDVPWEPAITQQVDWEAELGVIIGIGGRNISRTDALNHVFGYTVINDVTARDLQKNHLQFFKGKSLDGFCPMGPVVVTADEFGNPQMKPLWCRVNGEVKQQGTTADMLFPVNVIIEALSLGMTLESGDIIATGTPDGVGFGRTPPEFLGDGDELETEVSGIGVLRNRIRRVGTQPS